MDVETPYVAPPPPLPSVDPEFGSFHAGPVMGGLEDPELYLRLVANPFLGFVFLTGWAAVMYQTVAVGFAGPLTPMLLAMMVASLWLIPHLMHFHCLDCGGSGRMLRWRRHVCRRPVERRDARRPRLLRGPSPPVQVMLWFWGMMTAAILINALT